MRILIADDDPIALEILRSTLVKNGFEVEAVCNGVEALERIRTNAIRIVVSDLEMPQMGGVELCQAIRATDLSEYVYVILLTGHDDLDCKLHGLLAGADDYIIKPFEPSELLARIKVGERVLKSNLAATNRLLKDQIIHREQIEAELRKSQKRYQMLTEAAPVGIFHTDPFGQFVYLNHRWQAITGVSESSGLGFGWTETLHPEDRERVQQEFKAAVKMGTAFRNEFRFVKRDGSIIWVFGQAVAEIDDDGELVGYIGTVTDITESKIAQNEVSRLAAIVECSFDAIISHSLDGTITTWNGGAERIFGYSKSEVMGRPIAILSPPDQLNEDLMIMGAIRRGERVEGFETHRIRKNGTTIDVSLTVSPIMNGSNKIIGASQNARDITERRKAETALRDNEQRYHFLADAMPQIVWSAGQNGQTEYCNARWKEFTGLPDQSAIGNALEGILHEEDKPLTQTRWSKAIRSGKPFEMEHRLRRDDGSYRWHLSRAYPFRDESGRILQWIGTSTDIHDQKLVAQELKSQHQKLESANQELSSKNKKLGELYKTAQNFVDDVSHEFRTPLTVIKEFTAIMRDGLAGQTSPEQAEYLGIISNRVDDLATMVDDMLDISKLESGMLGVCRRTWTVEQIIEHVQSTLERKAAAHDAKLTFDVEDDLPPVYCDREKIGRVLINLTVNALKFSQEQGQVGILVRRCDQNRNTLTFGVSDNGHGIAPEAVTVIFNRFKQLGAGLRAGTKGFGLGLNIAKELVLLNFGEIALKSELAKGSTFFFSVPIADPQVVVKLWSEVTPRGSTDPVRVSLVAIRSILSNSHESADELDQFLQRNMRYSDVLLGVEPGTWVLASVADESACQAMIDRITQTLAEENRNRPADALPALKFQPSGAFILPNQQNELMRSFRELFAREECCV